MLLPELNLPVGFAGKDGFYWWIGQVEIDADNKFSNRYRVRIVGQHVKSCEAVDVNDLPWAVVMLPVTSPSSEGNSTYSPARLQKGDWVIGFFMDGAEGQHPVIMGSLQKVTKSTKNTSLSNNNSTAECLAFSRYVPDTNPKMALPESKQNDATARPGSTAGGGDSSPILNGTNDQQSVTNPHGRYACVQIADPTCTDTNSTKSKFEQTLTEFFGAVSKNGGQLGNQMLSDVTGKLYDYAGAANGYIKRVFGIARVYLKNAKFQMLALIKKGVTAILQFCLGIPVPTKNPKTGEAVKVKQVGVLGKVIQWLNEQLGLINCAIADLEQKLLDFLTNLIFGLVTEVISAATCKIEQIVQQILSELESFLTDIISVILGPLQAILGIIASPLNILGAILQYIFQLFGITCTGPDNKCKKSEQSQFCTGSANKKKPGEDDFAALDKLIADVESRGVADLQSSCTESTALPCPATTTANVYGGTPDPGQATGTPEDEPPEIEDPFDGFFDDIIPDPDAEGDDVSDEDPETIPVVPVNATVAGNLDLTLTTDATYIAEIDDITDYTWRSTLQLRLGSTSVDERTDDRYSLEIRNPIPTDRNLTYTLTADRTRVTRNETIRFTLTCTSGDVPDGTVFNYLMFGFIRASDFATGTNIGQMTMVNNVAQVSITIASEISITTEADVVFSVTEAGLSRQFYIYNNTQAATPIVTDRPPTFVPPLLGDPEVDEEGRILDIPIIDPGDPYITPPFINIAGEGIGASASAILDTRTGKLTRIKIERPGRNYTPNRINSNCVLDGFNIIRPGSGYTSEPIVTVNGEQGIARAVISNGNVIEIEVINKTKTYNSLPAVRVFGAGGAGTKVIPLLSCISQEIYETYAASIAPSGEAQVIDCP